MIRALRVWASAPPFSKVYVTPHIAHSGAVYRAPGHTLVTSGHIQAGIHVQTEEHRQAILERESSNSAPPDPSAYVRSLKG